MQNLLTPGMCSWVASLESKDAVMEILSLAAAPVTWWCAVLS